MRELICRTLEKERYVVETAAKLKVAIEKIDLYEYDCILLDIMLPDGNGFEILRQLKTLRKKENVIIISAKDSLEDKIQGLDLGADNYLPKPFHLAELTARVKSVLKRKHRDGENCITLGNVSLFPDHFQVSVDGNTLDLSRKEYDILHYFMVRPNRMVNKNILAESVWGDHIDQMDNFDFIYAQIKNLRKKLKGASASIEKADLKESIFILLVILFASLLVVILGVVIWVFHNSMKPFYRLLEWLEGYRLGMKNVPLRNPTNTTEFQKLNEAIVSFASHHEEIFEQQKLFIGNASHEIQTPLAVCMNRLEMLMEDEALSEDQLKEIVGTYQALEYASKLNKTLLLLSKIDNSQFVDEKEIDINELVKRYLKDYREVYAYKNVEVHVKETGSFKVRMNDVLTGILITNLLKNAFVHNVDNSCLDIVMDSGSIRLKNSAENGSLDGKHIFDRFYQAHKKEGSTGLGLALVDAVCQHSCININYHYEVGWHIFELKC